MWCIISLPLIPNSYRPGVGVPVRVPFMGQIDMFNNYSYLIRPSTKNSF